MKDKFGTLITKNALLTGRNGNSPNGYFCWSGRGLQRSYCFLCHRIRLGRTKILLLDEYLDAEKTTEHHAREIQRLVDKWDIDYIYIDSAAQQTRFDFAQNYDLSYYQR